MKIKRKDLRENAWRWQSKQRNPKSCSEVGEKPRKAASLKLREKRIWTWKTLWVLFFKPWVWHFESSIVLLFKRAREDCTKQYRIHDPVGQPHNQQACVTDSRWLRNSERGIGRSEKEGLCKRWAETKPWGMVDERMALYRYGNKNSRFFWFVCLFVFSGHAHDIQKLLDQGQTLSHSSENTKSLTARPPGNSKNSSFREGENYEHDHWDISTLF